MKPDGTERIKQRRIATGETAVAADRIAGAERRGFIDGVEVDFRHPDLSPEWEPLPQWYVWARPPIHAGILFPKEAALRLTDEFKQIKADLEDLPAIEAQPGDRVSVESVVPQIGDRRFDHPHDNQCRLAYLQLERGSGEVVRGIGPLAFYGATRIRAGAHRETFDHVLARIRIHTAKELYERGLNGSYPPSSWNWAMPLEDIARVMGAQAHAAFFKLLDLLPPDEGGSTARAHLRSLANDAVMAGFLLAKSEARAVEDRAMRQIAAARQAADTRRDDDLIEKGRDLEALHPTWKRNRIAKELLADYPHRELSSVNRSLAAAGVDGASKPRKPRK